jgi:hypothetical protein
MRFKRRTAMYRIIRVINNNRNFLVVEAQDMLTKETEVCYVSRELDLENDVFTKEDLQIIW